MTKERLDKILTDRGFFETKSRAQASVMAGEVKVNGEVITKAGYMIDTEGKIDFEIKTMPYVSRGGFKLEKALKEFNINLSGSICLDAGASTGGFTDCMLQKGALKVYSADTGYGQLAWKLRTDKRVKVIEKVNLKNCAENDIYSEGEEYASFIAADLSFISILKVLPNLVKLADKNGFEIVSLIKPQFEAGKEQADRGGGIIKDEAVHIEVIKNVIENCAAMGLYAANLTFSPIKGAKGNIEFLIHLSPERSAAADIDAETEVKKAHEQMKD